MSARLAKIMGWLSLIIFLALFGWLMFVFHSTPEREPEPTPPTDNSCEEVTPEVPAELPSTGVRL